MGLDRVIVPNNPVNYTDPSGLIPKGVLGPIRKWLKKNITPNGMCDVAKDKITSIIGLRTLADDLFDPQELGEGFDDEYMIRNFQYLPTPELKPRK